MAKTYHFVNGTPVEDVPPAEHPDDCDCERCERVGGGE
jgi:hypothetical protein